MSKIILIDRCAQWIDCILENTNLSIAVLIVQNEREKEKYLNNKRVFSVYTFKESFQFNDVSNIDYKLIEEYRSAQLAVENNNFRFISDYQIGKASYFNALSFWLGVFKKYEIKLVLIRGIIHQHPCDRIPMEIAIKNKIKCFSVENYLAHQSYIYDNNNNKFLNVEDNKLIDLDNNKFYKEESEFLETIEGKSLFIKKIISCLYNIGGYFLVKFLVCIIKRDFNIPDVEFSCNYFYKLKKFFRLILIKKFLEKNSTEIDSEDKFIYFPLHFEPEATIAGRAIMDSQLVAIQMLSHCLPEDWKIYVKEHPMQFNLNSVEFSFFIRSCEFYKSMEFYKYIKNIPKVKIIKSKVNSKLLLEKSVAVATFAGTIAIEAVGYKKPVIVFSADKTLLEECKDFFSIRSTDECFCAIDKIKNGFVPQYSDVDFIFNKYLTSDDNEGYKIATYLILKNIKK